MLAQTHKQASFLFNMNFYIDIPIDFCDDALLCDILSDDSMNIDIIMRYYCLKFLAVVFANAANFVCKHN